MASTLMDAAVSAGASRFERGITKLFMQESPILEDISMKKIDGRTYDYRQELALPTVQWRAVNQAYTESTGVLRPMIERLSILGGEVKVDNFIVKTQPSGNGAIDEKATQFAMKAQSASNEFDRVFFEGDDLVDVNQPMGMRRRLGGNQVLAVAAGGGTLTLALLDQLIDLVPFPNRKLYMNRTLRRKITALVNAVGGSILISEERDSFGRQQKRYNDIPIRIVETKGDASPRSASTRTPATRSPTARRSTASRSATTPSTGSGTATRACRSRSKTSASSRPSRGTWAASRPIWAS